MGDTKRAVVLAAGIGSRLHPLTKDSPKALVRVGEESILGRAVRLLATQGVTELIVATGFREDAIREALQDCPVKVSYFRNDAYDSTQNSVSLQLCAPALRGHSFFKLDGDVLFMPSVLERLAADPSDLAVAVDCGRLLDAEAMKVRADGSKILSFGKEIALEESRGESIGIELVGAEMSPRLFDCMGASIDAGDTGQYYEAYYSQLVNQGLQAGLVDVSDLPWTEIDDHDDLAVAERLIPQM